MRPNELDESDGSLPIERHHHAIITACHLEPHSLAIEGFRFGEVSDDLKRVLPGSRQCNFVPVLKRRFRLRMPRPERDQLVSGDNPHRGRIALPVVGSK